MEKPDKYIFEQNYIYAVFCQENNFDTKIKLFIFLPFGYTDYGLAQFSFQLVYNYKNKFQW